MILKRLPFFVAAFSLLTLASCQKKTEEQVYSESGLRANRVYYCDTVNHDQPIRMFTSAGEITDTVVINRYLALYPYISQGPNALTGIHPANIFSTPTRAVHLNGLRPFDAFLENGILTMIERDTSVYGVGSPKDSVEEIFAYESAFQELRNSVLEMNDSYTALTRVDFQNYRYFESFKIKGTYTNEVIELPYTFVALRMMDRSFPFAIKNNIHPAVPAGDTLLLQQGRVAFRMKN